MLFAGQRKVSKTLGDTKKVSPSANSDNVSYKYVTENALLSNFEYEVTSSKMVNSRLKSEPYRFLP